MTALTDFGSENVTKANPRERPEAPSRITVHDVTGPNCPK